MHVHIDPLRITVQPQHGCGVPVPAEKIEIGGPQRAKQQAVQNGAAVDEQELCHRRPARIGRQGRIARQAHPVLLDLDPQRILGKFGTQHPRGAPVQRIEQIARFGIGAEHDAALAPARHVAQHKTHRRLRQGQPADHLGNRLGFGAVGPQKLQPCGGGEEQVAQFDNRALRQRRRPHPPDPPARHRKRGRVFPRHARGDAKAPHRPKRRQRLAPETKTGNRQQV